MASPVLASSVLASPVPPGLIVNADDLGIHPSINAGIISAYRRGILTSCTMLMTTAASFLSGLILTTLAYAKDVPAGFKIGRVALNGSVAIALLFVWLTGNKIAHGRYRSLGEEGRSVWMEIQFPRDAYAAENTPPEAKQIAVELHTPETVSRGFASEWLQNQNGPSLRANVVPARATALILRSGVFGMNSNRTPNAAPWQWLFLNQRPLSHRKRGTLFGRFSFLPGSSWL